MEVEGRHPSDSSSVPVPPCSDREHGSRKSTGQQTAEPSGPKHTHIRAVTEAVSLSAKSKKAQGNMWQRTTGGINKEKMTHLYP